MIAERIRQARRMRHLNLRDLAEKAGDITYQAISNYELDKDTPSSAVLIRLAGALNVGVDYFFRTVTVQLGEPAYRAHCELPDKQKEEIESAAVDKLERYFETEALFGADATVGFGEPDELKSPVQSASDVEDRAVCLREHWDIGLDPLGGLVELLEDHGIRVVFVDTDPRFYGCAYREPQPLIVLNRNQASDRIRFSLAHELGHLVLRFPAEGTDDDREKLAHRFAGAFLVPAEAARKELGDSRASLSAYELLSLRRKYGMSVQAWICRAADLAIISRATSNRIWKSLQKSGLKTRELGEKLEREESNRHERLVVRAFTDRMISETKAARLLGSNIDEFYALVGTGG